MGDDLVQQIFDTFHRDGCEVEKATSEISGDAAEFLYRSHPYSCEAASNFTELLTSLPTDASFACQCCEHEFIALFLGPLP